MQTTIHNVVNSRVFRSIGEWNTKCRGLQLHTVGAASPCRASIGAVEANGVFSQLSEFTKLDVLFGCRHAYLSSTSCADRTIATEVAAHDRLNLFVCTTVKSVGGVVPLSV